VLFSEQDLDLLRLLRWCRYIANSDMNALFPEAVIANLKYMKLITLHAKSNAYVLTIRGNKFLDDHVEVLPANTPPSYRTGETERRLHTSRLALTAYRAGMSVFHTTLESLEQDPAFYLTAQSRIRGSNPWGSTRIAALARLGPTVYGMHYLFTNVGSVALTDELNAFNNNTANLRDVRRALIFAGASYADVLVELGMKGEAPDARLTSYAEAYRTVTLPIHLLSCDDTGAMQLQIMAQPDYRRRLTEAALKSHYSPAPRERPEWDAMFQGAPFVLAADMNLRRIDAAVRRAKKEGFRQIAMAALEGQAKTVLSSRYRELGLARIFTLSPEALSSLGELRLRSPSRRAYETSKGDVIDAPLIQAPRKAGGQGRT